MCKILKNIRGKTASELLMIYGIELNPPINLSLLLKRIGISVSGIDFYDVEKAANYEHGVILGAAIADGDELTIFYRMNDSENRKRFTIAHELAHCCLHTDNLKQNHIELRADCMEKDERETAADIFAGELLIPKSSLEKIYHQLFVPSLHTLSEIFIVSTNVMAARLDYLSMPYYKDTEYTSS